jgi:hypothetical protein
MPDTFFVGDHRQMFPLPDLSTQVHRITLTSAAMPISSLSIAGLASRSQHGEEALVLAPRPMFMPAFPIPYVQTNYLVPDAAAHFPTAFLPPPSYTPNFSSAVQLHGLQAAASPARAASVPMHVTIHPGGGPLPVLPGADFPFLTQLPAASLSSADSSQALALAVSANGPLVAPPWCPLPDETDKSILTRQAYGLPDDKVVFCNFNQLYKIDPQLFAAWVRILTRVPNSVLWLLRFPPPGEANLRLTAEKAGLGPDRIIFSNVACKSEHVRRGCLADLCLDTMTCNGHTTGMDILWSGTPMITLPGETLASRVAASQLTALGCPELIARSVDEYVELAVAYATEIPRLRAIQEKVRLRRAMAPLFNTQHLAHNLERAYRMMHDHFVSGRPREPIYVPQSPVLSLPSSSSHTAATSAAHLCGPTSSALGIHQPMASMFHSASAASPPSSHARRVTSQAGTLAASSVFVPRGNGLSSSFLGVSSSAASSFGGPAVAVAMRDGLTDKSLTLPTAAIVGPAAMVGTPLGMQHAMMMPPLNPMAPPAFHAALGPLQMHAMGFAGRAGQAVHPMQLHHLGPGATLVAHPAMPAHPLLPNAAMGHIYLASHPTLGISSPFHAGMSSAPPAAAAYPALIAQPQQHLQDLSSFSQNHQ